VSDPAAAGPPKGHGSAGQAVRSVTFVAIMYALMLGMGLVALPFAMASRRAALDWCKRYCRWTLWLAEAMCGTRHEIRGPVPRGPCIVAAKHQSFLDVILLTLALPRPRFVMKRELLWTPVVGYFARRIGCIAIDRSARGEAVRTMVSGVRELAHEGGQVIIFPQGTRVAPGLRMPYRGGVLKLYAAFGLPIALAAANTGWYWPRTGTRRTPGTAAIEFLGTIEPGLPVDGLLERIEREIEDGSERLAREAAAEIAGHRPASPG
jgi:1-acyl-sn-glycerol-3-phosphate acyltransferase